MKNPTKKDIIHAIKKQQQSSKRFKLSNLFGYKFWIGGVVVALVGIVIYSLLYPEPQLSDVLVNDDSFIQHINTVSRAYQAKASKRFEGWTFAEVKKYLGHSFVSSNWLSISSCIAWSKALPDNFDSRISWPNCYSHATVVDQGNCSSSWVIAPIGALSKRMCILDELKEYYELSPQQILSCADHRMNCDGGFVDVTYQYAQQQGIASNDCFPYQGEAVPCSLNCVDDTFIKIDSVCRATGEDGIMSQIYSSGPLTTLIPIYNDFLVYSKGVYEPIKTATILFHREISAVMMQAVQIIGWGTDGGVPYWLIENSWGPDWGDNGYAKISRTAFTIKEAFAATPIKSTIGELGEAEME